VPWHPAGARAAGRVARIVANLPDGRVEPLLWLYRFDPKWRRTFVFREPLNLPKGTVIASSTPLRFLLETAYLTSVTGRSRHDFKHCAFECFLVRLGGFVNPLIFRTNCSAAPPQLLGCCGSSGRRSTLMPSAHRYLLL